MREGQRDVGNPECETRRWESIRHNIERLGSVDAQKVLSGESMGGNAGATDFGDGWIATHMALNTYVNPGTAKIALIGNSQYLHPKELEGLVMATFRFGFFSKGNKGSKVYISNVYGSNLSLEQMSILEDSSKFYNIKKVENFEELYFALNAVGPITTSKQQTFTPAQMIHLIEETRNGRMPLAAVTNTYGVHDKVVELMSKGVVI